MNRLLSFLRRCIFKEFREIIGPLSTEGIDVREIESEGGPEGHVSANEFGEGVPRLEVFTPSTVILKNGHGVWEIAVPREIRESLVDATLRIETVRTHGMLHSPDKGTSASVSVDGELVDRIYLVKPHPHGEEFGIDSRRPYPIFWFIDRTQDLQTVRIEVGENVMWDIDRLSIEGVVLRREIRPEVAMVVGAFISAALGAIVSILIWYLGQCRM